MPYKANALIKTTVQSLLALPFILLNDVEEVLYLIIECSDADDEDEDNEDYKALHRLLKFVDEFYISGVPGRGRRRAVNPRFAPSLWNCYDKVVINRLQRSTNVVE